jgi:hypothetical protein
VSRRLLFRPQVYQPLLVLVSTGLFDLLEHFVFHAFSRPRDKWAVIISDFVAGSISALAVIFWQRTLRTQVRHLQLHMQTRKAIQHKMFDSLQIIQSIAENNTHVPDARRRHNALLVLQQVAAMKRFLNFDPTALVELSTQIGGRG